MERLLLKGYGSSRVGALIERRQRLILEYSRC